MNSNKRIKVRREEVIRPAVPREKIIKRSVYRMLMDYLKGIFARIRRRGKEPIVLSCNSDHKTRWDLFVMFLATYNCIQIPLEVAFDPDILQQSFLKTFGVLVDIIFFLDILVAFRTTYIDIRNGQEIMELKALAYHYLFGSFWVDFLSTVPFDTFAELILGEAGLFKFLGALKLIRITRLGRMITYLRSNEETKAILKLFQLIFYLIMYVHCCGCIWWLLIKDSVKWVPLFWYGDSDNWFLVYSQNYTYQYCASIHTAMMVMTGNCIGPRTTGQIVAAAFGLFMGAIINANIFGELAVLITGLSSKNNDFQNKMTQVNTTISNLRLPDDLGGRIRDFVIANQDGLDS